MASIGDAFLAKFRDILARLRTVRLPCALVNNFAKALSDPQVLACNMVIDVPLQIGKSVRMPGNPFKFSGDTASAVTPPPLGERTELVLRPQGFIPIHD